MDWKQQLFKPKWQHKDADIRLAAVGAEQDPQLINSLVDIAGSDDDSRVRSAAIKRLHQLENILKLYANETDLSVRTLLEDRIRQLSTSSDDSRPALDLRLQVVSATADRKLIEHLASHAPEAQLRRAALAKVKRQGLLGDCCIQDSDSENRRFAASRITQHTTLARVINGLRKRDKTLHAQLQERLHGELLERADPGAVQTEALNICTALERLAVNAGDKDTQAIDARHMAWKRIANMAAPEMADRYQRICQRLEAPAKISPPEETARVESEPETQPVQEAPPQSAAAPQASEEPPQADRQRAAAREEQRKQLEQNLDEAKELLAQLGQELEQGELHKALETRTKIQQAGKGHGKHKGWQQVNRKTAGMQGRLRELREWHHWSNNKIRKRLIAEMEVLPAAGLHPDALLDRVKSLQAEWKTLEESEQIPGDKHFAAAPWMWRKFSAAGHTAFDTAKPYLEKRSEIQSRHAQSLTKVCAELQQLADTDPPDWTALGKAMNRGRQKLRDLNNVPAKQRQAFARKLKAALDKANNVMQDHYQLVEKEKMKLIRSASQLIHLPERSEAIAQAKSLQSAWKAAGSLWRSKEQELWNQFREHLDPLFEELKEQQETIRAAKAERLAAQNTLCEEMQAILKSDKDLSAQHGIVQGLQDSWKDIEHPERKLLASFRALVADYEQRVKQAQQQQMHAEHERRWLKSMLLHELTVSGRTAKGAISKKTQTKVEKTWPEQGSDDVLEIKMDKACADMLAGKPADPGEDDAEDLKTKARMLCIRLEFLAGLQSPDEDRDQRMQYQVDRLAASMSGKSARLPASDEAHDAEKTWLGMYALPEPEFETFGKRIKRALTAILETH
ncbi:MAG: hypothetical protein BMS9Abin30_0704 [Gammaproteobacteria bacterium]|nr:MAG: hypothetical protein BMS9Abin30_0704 [Gammaproteobacteria bacterium]